MDILHYAEIALAAFIAGTIDTVVGFGGGLLLLPILVLMVGTLDAVLLTALIPLGWNIPRILLLRNWIDWNKTMWFTLGILPGALFGGQLLGHLDAATVRVGIGCVMVLFGGYYILRLYVDLPKERLPGLWPLPVVGLLTGAVSAWVGAGNGPLQTWALDASGLNAHQAAATNGALGGITAVARCIAYGIAGELHSGLIPTAVVGTAGAVAGALLGVRYARRTKDSTLELVVGLAIVLAGIRMFFSFGGAAHPTPAPPAPVAAVSHQLQDSAAAGWGISLACSNLRSGW
ncbi:MAG: sulfite exporter TauE/SafE family protein [Chlorobi bacterium]|nr:sulfite exporter TauE/SafE family protein [Chlorobiota bacterium]